MKHATFKFGKNGMVTITTIENTKHAFTSVSAAIAWCRGNGVEPYPS